jgi:serine/threonine protein kinase
MHSSSQTEHSSRRKSTNEEDKPSSQPTRRASSFHASSSSQVTSPRTNGTNKNSASQRSPDSHEMTEQQIAEYAGKRAMLRLEQEFTDAHNDRKTSSSFHSATSMNSFISVMDRRKLSRVPQVSKSDLIIGEYLGRGNFCDVFEVEWAMKNALTGERLIRNESFDDDSLASDEDGEDATRRKMEYLSLVCSNDIRPEIIGINRRGEIDADAPIIGSRRLRGSFSQVHTGTLLNSSARNLRDPNVMALKCLRPAVRAQPRKFVIGAEDLAHETALLSCLDHPNIIKIYGRAKGSFATAFQFGSSKVSVSSGGSNGKKKERSMNDGYFIILDKLTATLDGTIGDWKDEYDGLSERLHLNIPLPLNVPPPECNLIEHLAKRIKVAYSIASALEYLHSRHVVFRDLKPANVGFDCNDCVKMFDFGFATSIAPLLNEQIRSGREQRGYGPLTETCGTRRYMAPEVALKLGYGKEVDVYSFGMLLWEICAMEKPFDSIQSVDDFHDLVVLCGSRPPLNNDPLWTRSLKQLMSRCWSTDPYDRPDMSQVKSMLCVVLRDMNIATMKLKQLRADQARTSSFKRDESSSSSQTPPREPQQPSGFLNKFRRRASIA